MRLLVGITVLAVLCPQLVGAQERFFNFVEGWRNNGSFEIQDGYLLFGLGSINPPFEHELVQNEIGINGDSVEINSFNIDTVASTTTYLKAQMAIQIDMDHILIGGHIGDNSQASYFGALYKYNIPLGVTELITTISEEDWTEVYCLKRRNDTSLLVGTYVLDTAQFIERTRLYEMDMDGNIRWQRTFYGGSLTDTRPQQIEVMSNGNIALLLNEWDPNYPAFHEHEQAIVVMMDSVGNELWRVSPGDTAGHRIWPGGMVELPNGELLISYTDPYYYDEEGEWRHHFYSTVHFDKYDASGNWLSTDSLAAELPNGYDAENPNVLYRVRQMQMLSDGNILISGHTGVFGLLIKMDADGNVVWYNMYSPHINDSYNSIYTSIYHTLPTSDGGYLCTGQYRRIPDSIYPGGIQTAIALKVDEYGCLEEGCGPTDAVAELPTEQGLQVYPNPGKGLFTIQPPKSPEGGLGNRTGHLEVLDIHGRTVHSRSQLAANSSQLTIDLTAQPSGLYLVRLLTEKEVFTVKIIKE